MNWIIIQILQQISTMLNDQQRIDGRLAKIEEGLTRVEGKLDRLQASVDEGNQLARENNGILKELQDQLVIRKAVGLKMTAGPVVEQ